MLTLATFVLEKFGGDTLEDVRASLARYRERIAEPRDGGRRRRAAARPRRHR